MSKAWEEYVKVNLNNDKNKERVVHIIIDGVSNDFLYNRNLKNIGKLMKSGFHYEKCYSIFPTLTGPAHTSMNSGALPIDTGVNLNMYYDFENNKLLHINPLKYSKAESIAETLSKGGRKTAGICGHMNRGLNYFVSEAYLGHDAEKITDYSIEALNEFAPDYIQLVYFTVDTVQHYYGAKSKESLESLLWVDKEIGRLIDYLERNFNNFNIVISADHGQDTIKNDISDKLYKIILECGFNYYGYGRFVVIKSTKKADKNRLIKSLENKDYVKTILFKNELIKLGVDPTKIGTGLILLNNGYGAGTEYKGDHGSYTKEEALVPLVFYGSKIKKGSSKRACEIIDTAPTIADILNVKGLENNKGQMLKDIYGVKSNYKKDRLNILAQLLKK